MTMTEWLDPLLVIVLLLNFTVLGASHLRTVIRVVAMQGVLLGTMILLVHDGLSVRTSLVASAAIVLKGLVIPRMLSHAIREVNIRREVEPIIGFIASLLLGAIGTGLAVVFARTLPIAQQHMGTMLVPASLATAWTGFLILATRVKAISQVLGYLLLENGIFIFGLLLYEAMPLLVEAGVLLDLFVAVFVMGITIHRINREFSTVNTQLLSALRD
jgi:hydrogenase-4 component E